MYDQVEYRVVWKRKGYDRKTKKYATRKGAENLYGLLTSGEPWLFYAPECDPDAPIHCPDQYNEAKLCAQGVCDCMGHSERERAEAFRAELPPLEYARIEYRPVGDWEGV